MKSKLLYLTLILILLNTASFGEVFKGGSFSLSGTYKFSYDDNVLRYSKRDYDNARNGTESTPSPTETLDDIRSDFKLSATYRFKILNRSGRFGASGNFGHYLFNSFKNFGWASIYYKQKLVDKINIQVSHFYEPYYFLRDYLDVQTNSREHCDFAMTKSVGKLYYRPIKMFEIAPYYEFKRYSYNEYFTEYDGDRIGIGAEGIFRKGPWRVALDYSFGTYDNLGFDSESLFPSGVDTEDSETGDGDYEEDSYNFSIFYSLKILDLKSRIKVEETINDRYYMTERLPADDPIHHGRNDLVFTSKVSMEMKLSKRLEIEIGTTIYKRDSEGSSPLIPKVKNYSRKVAWLEFSYDLI